MSNCRYLAQLWPNEKGKDYWLCSLYELKNYTTNGWSIVAFYDGDQEKAGIMARMGK